MSNGQAWAKIVPYIDVHAITAILDDVVGPENYEIQHVDVPNVAPGLRLVKLRQNRPTWEDGPQGRRKVDRWDDFQEWVCHTRITIHLPDGRTIMREAIGTNDSPTTQTGGKGADSDGVKRAGARYGIGAWLATQGETTIRGNENFDMNGDRIYRMLDDGPAVLKAVENWRRAATEAGAGVANTRAYAPAPAPAAAHDPGQSWDDDPGPDDEDPGVAAAWAASAPAGGGQSFPPPSPHAAAAAPSAPTGQWSPLFNDGGDAKESGTTANDRWAALLAYAGGNSEVAAEWMRAAGVEKTGGLAWGGLWREVLKQSGISAARAA